MAPRAAAATDTMGGDTMEEDAMEEDEVAGRMTGVRRGRLCPVAWPC
ncbi:hypothetical protein [Frankia sp. CiP1_Cm_nod1]